VPTTSGVHTLRIFSPDTPAESGNYTVTVKKIADDHGNDRDNATELTLGLPEAGVTDFNGDVDMFSFEANEGWVYELKKSGFAVEEFWVDEFQPYTGPKEDDNFDSVITWSAPSTSRYYYQTFGIEPGTTYTVTISGEPDDHVDRDLHDHRHNRYRSGRLNRDMGKRVSMPLWNLPKRGCRHPTYRWSTHCHQESWRPLRSRRPCNFRRNPHRGN